MPLFFLLIFLFTSLHATSLSKAVDAYLAHEGKDFNGCVVILKKDTVLFEAANGIKNHDTKEPLQLTTRFCVGSITKSMTAALILRLVEENKLDLHTPVNEKPYTTHQLLNHTSGIVSIEAPPKTSPGSTFDYSNIGYEMLGQILEKHLKKDRQQIYQDFYSEVEMGDSFLPSPPFNLAALYNSYPKLAKGYHQNILYEGTYDFCTGPGGWTISTAYDIAKWGYKLFNGFLTPDSLDLMTTPFIQRKHRYSPCTFYGYGIQIVKEENVLEYSHSGYVTGYVSTLLHYPEESLTCAILENQTFEDLTYSFRHSDAIRTILRHSISSPQD